jgi:hypothetical protein
MWMIANALEHRIFEEDFASREEAEARIAELVAEDPSLEERLLALEYPADLSTPTSSS